MEESPSSDSAWLKTYPRTHLEAWIFVFSLTPKCVKGGNALFKKLVGSLMCLTMTRPHIMYRVSLISRFMESQKDSQWQVGKIILRYLSGKKNIDIIYSTSEIFKLIGYIDNEGNTNDMKLISRYIFHFCTVVLWASKKHLIVNMSSTKAESTCQSTWM